MTKPSHFQWQPDGPAGFRREFPDSPIVGVGAIVIDGNRVLLVRRGREPLKGEWSLPGGALELGETLEAGVCREVAEETGIEVKTVAIVEVLDKIVVAEDGSAGKEEGTHREAVDKHKAGFATTTF